MELKNILKTFHIRVIRRLDYITRYSECPLQALIDKIAAFIKIRKASLGK